MITSEEQLKMITENEIVKAKGDIIPDEKKTLTERIRQKWLGKLYKDKESMP